MIEVKNVTKKYGELIAVNDLSFDVKDGEIIGLLGQNGAGKSTTMNMITGFIEPTQGSIAINGYDISKKPKKAKKANRIYARKCTIIYRIICKRICKLYGRIKISK